MSDKAKVATATLLGGRIVIEFPSGDLMRIEPSPTGEPRITLAVQIFKALTLRPKGGQHNRDNPYRPMIIENTQDPKQPEIPPLPSATGSALPTHVCAKCGHWWQSAERDTAKAIIKSVKMNGAGPFCSLCYHLEMVVRFAAYRGDAALAKNLRAITVLPEVPNDKLKPGGRKPMSIEKSEKSP